MCTVAICSKRACCNLKNDKKDELHIDIDWNKGMIRQYRSDYIDYFPEEWTWSLKNTKEDRDMYRRYRMRHSKPWYKDNDKLPFFDSIEKDANQFGFERVEFVDVFGAEFRRWLH